MIYFHGWLANIQLSLARLVLDLSLYIFIDDPTASSLQPVSMLVSVDTCGMSASIMSHSQFCLPVIGHIYLIGPITRRACDPRLYINLRPNSLQPPACSYLSMYVPLLLSSYIVALAVLFACDWAYIYILSAHHLRGL